MAWFLAAFWIAMIMDCWLHEPDRSSWILLLVLLNVFGAGIYCLTRFLPRQQVIRAFLSRWIRRQELWQAESLARTLKNAHQDMQLGNLLRELKLYERAIAAYQDALTKEPQNLQALWGISDIALESRNYSMAETYLETLLKLDPNYKFGDASLAYARTLIHQENWPKAQDYLAQFPLTTAHPEQLMMMAKVLIKKEEPGSARLYLQTLIDKIRTSPGFYFKRYRHLIFQAQWMLFTLPKPE